MKLLVNLFTMLFGVFLFSQNNKIQKEKTLKIPIVFHIIHKSKTSLDYPDSVFHNLVEKVNKGFNNVNIKKIESLYQKDVATCNIEFYIPKIDNCENFQAISWHKTNKSVFSPFNDKEIKTLKNGLIDNNKVLNVWIFPFNTPPEILDGRAVKKGKFSGISLAIRTIDNGGIGFLLTHEIGHFLNLEHIWGTLEDPAGISCVFDYYDDYVPDTPKQKEPNKYQKIITGDTVKVCFKPKINSNYENFMDYAYQATSMFTKGQKKRMRDYLEKNRQELTLPFTCPVSKEPRVSVLHKSKLRSKFGTRMIVNGFYPFGTITDRDMIELFNSVGIIPTKENLKKMGLEIVANNKFKDVATGEFVNQHQIYQRLDLDKAKAIYKNISISTNENLKNGNIDFNKKYSSLFIKNITLEKCPYKFNSYNFKEGDDNVGVLRLNQFLNNIDKTKVALTGTQSPGNETSLFTKSITNSVKKFQRLNNLSETGILDSNTKAKMYVQCNSYREIKKAISNKLIGSWKIKNSLTVYNFFNNGKGTYGNANEENSFKEFKWTINYNKNLDIIEINPEYHSDNWQIIDINNSELFATKSDSKILNDVNIKITYKKQNIELIRN